MASREKGKAPMMEEGENTDTKPKDYRDALAFLTRLKDLIGPKFEEFCCHFCEFMDKRIDRQTFFETKAWLLLKEHPDLLTDMPQALCSIDGWDQNLCENLRADLIRICSASAPSSSSTQSEPKTSCPLMNSGIQGTSGQVNVSSGNEHLNQEVAVRKPPTGEYWQQQGLSYVWQPQQGLSYVWQPYAPQQLYVQQQRQAHTPQQSYVQPQPYAPWQLYVQQQRQAHTPQQSYAQPQWYAPHQLYVQQQPAHMPQQSYNQPQWYAPQQQYVQQQAPQQQYVQLRAMPQWYMPPQFHSQPRWWYVNTSPRTKRD